MARVKSQLRRYLQLGGGSVTASVLRIGGIELDDDAKTVRLDGEAVNLTPKEYDILRFLMQNPGKVFSRVDLMEQVWNYGYVGDDARTVDVTVRRLREKIEDNPAAPAYILTRRGVGYYFSAQA